MQKSWLDEIKTLSREEILDLLDDFTDDEVDELLHDWSIWARPSQLAPEGDWLYWLILAGRGFGKTRTGAEWTIQQIRAGYNYVNLMGATSNDARGIMVDGESGIIACCPKSFRPEYKTHKNELHWPNGAISRVFTADSPERLRGQQHSKIWADELCAWRYQDSWDQAMFGLRLGDKPQALITTTPKPTKLIRDIAKDARTHVTRGSTFDNKANLAKNFIEAIVKKYEGTRLGRQELNAEILEDNPGALWKRPNIDSTRKPADFAKNYKRIIVAIDPAVTNTDTSDETGLVVVAIDDAGHGYLLEDASMKGSSNEWATKAIELYRAYAADRIVAEVNQGGDLVETIIRNIDENVSYKSVRASKGKFARAEPIAALYEQNRISHVGFFAHLEDQLCEYDPSTAKKSPDRLDALVWGFTELFEPGNGGLLDFYKNKSNLSDEQLERINKQKEKLEKLFAKKKSGN